MLWGLDHESGGAKPVGGSSAFLCYERWHRFIVHTYKCAHNQTRALASISYVVGVDSEAGETVEWCEKCGTTLLYTVPALAREPAHGCGKVETTSPLKQLQLPWEKTVLRQHSLVLFLANQ